MLASPALAFNAGRTPTAGAACATESEKQAAHSAATSSDCFHMVVVLQFERPAPEAAGCAPLPVVPSALQVAGCNSNDGSMGMFSFLAGGGELNLNGVRVFALVRCASATQAKVNASKAGPPSPGCFPAARGLRNLAGQ